MVRVSVTLEPGGVALGGAVALFVIAKAAGLVPLPWLWVLAPLWVPAGLALLVVLMVGLLGLAFGE